MPIVADILATWRHPRRVIRQMLAEGPREDRALAALLGGAALLFVAQWPRLLREAEADPSVPFDARLGAAMLALLFILPLVFYALAMLSHLIALAFGGAGSGHGARRALFWAFLSASPLLLVNGLASGLIGQGALVTIIGFLALGWFIYLWIAMLIEVEAKP